MNLVKMLFLLASSSWFLLFTDCRIELVSENVDMLLFRFTLRNAWLCIFLSVSCSLLRLGNYEIFKLFLPYCAFGFIF